MKASFGTLLIGTTEVLDAQVDAIPFDNALAEGTEPFKAVARTTQNANNENETSGYDLAGSFAIKRPAQTSVALLEGYEDANQRVYAKFTDKQGNSWVAKKVLIKVVDTPMRTGFHRLDISFEGFHPVKSSLVGFVAAV